MSRDLIVQAPLSPEQPPTERALREMTVVRDRLPALPTMDGSAPGFLGLLGLKATAWKVEQATEAQLRILYSQHRLLEGQQAVLETETAVHRAQRTLALERLYTERALVESQQEAGAALAEARWAAREREARAARAAEEAEANLALDRHLRRTPAEKGIRVLGVHMEVERLLLERERLQQERRDVARGLAPPRAPVVAEVTDQGATADDGPGLEPHLSDRQIERLAQKAVIQFAGLGPEKAEAAWDEWRRRLPEHVPAYAAAEVARRAEELRGLVQ